MKILLLGANGQLGQILYRTLSLIAKVKACDRSIVDLTRYASIRTSISTFQPDVIVNAAAYTAVDKAESERELTFAVNTHAVNVLATEVANHNILLIHYSTDYIFDGLKKGSYSESDTPNPINVYGESKLAGEKAIILSGCKHYIFRTSWVIGKNGHNFAKTILRLAKERNTLGIINDQLGVPTTPNLIAKVTATAIKTPNPWPFGIYHLSPRGETSWFGIAQVLLQLAEMRNIPLSINKNSLYPIKTIEYPVPATRPKNSLLNTSKLTQQLNFNLPHWKPEFLKIATKIINNLEQNNIS